MQIIKIFIEPLSNEIFDHHDYIIYKTDVVVSDKEVFQEYWGAWAVSYTHLTLPTSDLV